MLKYFIFFLVSSVLYLSIGKADSSAPLSKSIKVLSINAGNTNFKIHGTGFEPTCPVYKLCSSKIIDRVRNHIVQHDPDVVFLQEALGLEQLTKSSATDQALLPSDYIASCGRGAGGLHEVCIAWKKTRAQLVAKSCLSLYSIEGGSLKCSLKVDGLEIDFINLHPSFVFKADRDLVIKDTWAKLVTLKKPTVIGGDFNTEDETFSVNNDKPYPSEFGTLLGRTVKDYGRWPGPFNSYGNYILSPDTSFKFRSYLSSTVFLEKIDHLFANFGKPMSTVPARPMPCHKSACLGNHDGYAWGDGQWTYGGPWGPNVDHLPLLILLEWE